jgi:hypothetical protein
MFRRSNDRPAPFPPSSPAPIDMAPEEGSTVGIPLVVDITYHLEKTSDLIPKSRDTHLVEPGTGESKTVSATVASTFWRSLLLVVMLSSASKVFSFQSLKLKLKV